MKKIALIFLTSLMVGCGTVEIDGEEQIPTREYAELYIRETIEPTEVSPDAFFEDEVIQIETYSPMESAKEEAEKEDVESDSDDEAERPSDEGGDREAEEDTDEATDESSDALAEPDVSEDEPVAEEIVEEAEEEPQNEAEKSYYGNCRITFYCSCSLCCGAYAGGPTASGAMPTAGWTVANGSLPFGTLVEIEGHTYCVEDRGVSGDQFDIFVNSHEEALQRGLYYTDVYVIEG